MTKLSIALTAMTLSISLAPAAKAYSTEPEFTVTHAAVTSTPVADAGEVCISKITPELAAVLALPVADEHAGFAKLACVDD